MPDNPPLFDRIARLIADAHRDAATAVVADIKDRVGVPVGYAIGPRGGVQKIRSKPGEPPRKDTGRLQASLTTETIQTDSVIDTVVSTEVPYARRLEIEMQRPIFENQVPVTDRLFIQKITENLSEL